MAERKRITRLKGQALPAGEEPALIEGGNYQMSETAFEREVLDRLTTIEAKLDSFDAAKKQTYKNENEIIRLNDEVKNQNVRIGHLEDSNKWLTRALAGAIITSVVGVVFVLIRLGAGI